MPFLRSQRQVKGNIVIGSNFQRVRFSTNLYFSLVEQFSFFFCFVGFRPLIIVILTIGTLRNKKNNKGLYEIYYKYKKRIIKTVTAKLQGIELYNIHRFQMYLFFDFCVVIHYLVPFCVPNITLNISYANLKDI